MSGLKDLANSKSFYYHPGVVTKPTVSNDEHDQVALLRRASCFVEDWHKTQGGQPIPVPYRLAIAVCPGNVYQVYTWFGGYRSVSRRALQHILFRVLERAEALETQLAEVTDQTP